VDDDSISDADAADDSGIFAELKARQERLRKAQVDSDFWLNARARRKAVNPRQSKPHFGRSASLRTALAVGGRVQLTGLKAKPELNGLSGTVRAFDTNNQRFEVELDDGCGHCILKKTNLVREVNSMARQELRTFGSRRLAELVPPNEMKMLLPLVAINVCMFIQTTSFITSTPVAKAAFSLSALVALILGIWAC